MSADDANDTPGEPGACPGHEWKVGRVFLRPTGGSMSVVCKWCGTVDYYPSASDGT
ncbi:hypothetical protein [Glutamicibacter sp. MCAF14]|uniref:hypothetical protein n=1 Tax=Glutamicibacter sp. MCAF14 TaxID=3233043 RepID=UPI003F91359F